MHLPGEAARFTLLPTVEILTLRVDRVLAQAGMAFAVSVTASMKSPARALS